MIRGILIIGEMKSAWQKAMERAEKLGQPSAEEIERLNYIPLGNALAAQYFKEEDYNLLAEITKYKGSSAEKYIVESIEDILLRNIFLPRDEQDRQVANRAMAGIRLIKKNRKLAESILSQIDNLLNYYEQARQQTFTQLKGNFESKLQGMAKALEQQSGINVSINSELQPQFQEAWLKTSSQMDAQYDKILQEHEQQISRIA